MGHVFVSDYLDALPAEMREKLDAEQLFQQAVRAQQLGVAPSAFAKRIVEHFAQRAPKGAGPFVMEGE